MNKYKMDKDRLILRAYLDELHPGDVVELAEDYNADVLAELKRTISDYIARTLDPVEVKNVIADEIGHEEYFRKLEKLNQPNNQKDN